jgi:hypothetical protein
MSHNTRGSRAPEQVKRHNTTVRINDADKDGLRSMTEEHPLYTESIIIRAALQVLLACSSDVRTAIVLASLNEKDVSDVIRRHGMGYLTGHGGAHVN